MRRLFFRWAAAALLAGALMIPAAEAAQLQIDDRIVEPSAAWTEEGTPYVTLAALCQAADGYTLSWNGTAGGADSGGPGTDGHPRRPLRGGQRQSPVCGARGTGPGWEDRPAPGGGWAEAAGLQLTWDEVEGAAWLSTDQAQPASASYPAEDLYWLSRIISAESRGEPLLGQIAVGNVILNRVESSQYPDTVEGVVFDTKYGVQFQPVSNGTIYDALASSSLVAAKLCLEGTDVVGESLYFFSPALSAGRWIVSNATYYTTIGGHSFMSEKLRRGADAPRLSLLFFQISPSASGGDTQGKTERKGPNRRVDRLRPP